MAKTAQFLILILPATAIIACFACHLFWQTCFWKTHPLKQRGIAWLIFGVSIAYSAVTAPLGPVIMGYIFVASLGYSYAYFHLFNMANTARRIQLLILRLSESAETISNQAEAGFELRIQRLQEMGVVEKRGVNLYAKQSLLLFAARAIGAMRHLFYSR